MVFTHPAFLWGLLALSIPIVVHLFNFRRYQTLYFSNTQFVKELQENTKRQSQLKKWIVLLLRMAAIFSLCMAFAQLVRKPAQTPFSSGEAYVQIFIDNSYSMENRAEQGSLMHEAMQKAKALADAFGDDAVFMLLTQDLKAEHACFLSRTEIKKEIDRLQSSPQSRSLESIMQYAFTQMGKVNNPNKQLFIFSDFQQSVSDFAGIPADSSIRICLIPLKANIEKNFFIDTCWFDSPVMTVGQNAELSVMLQNEGNEDMEKLPVKLYINNRQKAIASADIKANGHALLKIPFTITKEGFQNARLEITDYPITFDDQLYFSFQTTSSHSVLRIHEKKSNHFLQALFASDSSISYQQMFVQQMDYGQLIEQDLVILDQLEENSGGFAQNIVQYVENGGNVLIIPSTEPQKALNNPIHQALQITRLTNLDTHRCQLSEINMEHALYHNTFEKNNDNMHLPRIFKHYKTDNSIHNNKEILLRMDNQDELLSIHKLGKGSVYLLTVPLDDSFSEWQRHALFVPTLYNMAILKYNQRNLYYTVGSNEPIPVQNNRLPAQAVPQMQMGSFSFIPERRNQPDNCELFVHDQIQEAGNYSLVFQNDTLQNISFNYDRNESEMKFWSADDLKKQTKDIGGMEVYVPNHSTASSFARQLQQQAKPSLLFVWLTLFFLLSESILLRVWKM